MLVHSPVHMALAHAVSMLARLSLHSTPTAGTDKHRYTKSPDYITDSAFITSTFNKMVYSVRQYSVDSIADLQ